MSEMAGILVLTDLEISDFSVSLPRYVDILARLVLFNHAVIYGTLAFARLIQKSEPRNELVDYIANYDESHLDDAYANVMEDVLNDWIARWRSGSN